MTIGQCINVHWPRQNMQRQTVDSANIQVNSASVSLNFTSSCLVDCNLQLNQHLSILGINDDLCKIFVLTMLSSVCGNYKHLSQYSHVKIQQATSVADHRVTWCTPRRTFGTQWQRLNSSVKSTICHYCLNPTASKYRTINTLTQIYWLQG